MTGLVRKATLLLAACGLLVAGAAYANVPDPAQSEIPARVFLVGANSASQADGFSVNAADGAGAITVTVRDLSGALINNSLVAIDFSGCADSRICAVQGDPSLVVECPAKVIRKFTTAGVATFIIQGVGNVTGFPLPTTCVKIYADGVLLGSTSAAVYDHLGNGVGAADLAAWVDDFVSQNNPSRSDYIGATDVGATDLAKWVDVFVAQGSIFNCVIPSGTCN